MKNIVRLTDLEVLIMKTLWDNGSSMTNQEIAEKLKEENLSTPSVAQAMKHLLAKDAVVVKDHVLVSNVYARTFAPNYTREEYLQAEYKRVEKTIFGRKKANVAGIALAILGNSNEKITEEDAEKLEELIEEKRIV